MLLPRFLKDACRLYSFCCIYIFLSAFALTLGSPTGLEADLTWLDFISSCIVCIYLLLGIQHQIQSSAFTQRHKEDEMVTVPQPNVYPAVFVFQHLKCNWKICSTGRPVDRLMSLPALAATSPDKILAAQPEAIASARKTHHKNIILIPFENRNFFRTTFANPIFSTRTYGDQIVISHNRQRSLPHAVTYLDTAAFLQVGN